MGFARFQRRWQIRRRERTGRWRATIYTRDRLNREVPEEV